MNRVWRILTGALCLGWALTAAAQWQGRMTQNDAIDIAGMQRMLSQRILKTYCEVGLGEWYGNPKEQLEKAVKLFELNLMQLDDFAAEPTIREALGRVQKVWPAYKEIALRAADKDGARQLMVLNRQLLPLANDVVVRMEKVYKTQASEWVNIAGRQRMLSQRMAMFYLMKIWGVADASDEQAADKAASEYAAALEKLKGFSGNNAETNGYLKTLAVQSHLLATVTHDSGQKLTFMVATTSEKMLEAADKLTAAYANMGQ